MTATIHQRAGSRFSVPRTILWVGMCLATLFLPACAWDGHIDVAGYSSKPNYDTRYRTIRVPMCRNHTYMTVTPTPGMEMDLHRAIVREIQLKTPYRISQDDADTELMCTVVNFQKNLLNYTQFNTVREAETILVVELYWRDLRTGEILTKASRRFGDPRDPEQRQPLLSTPDTMMPAGVKPIVGATTPTPSMPGAVDTGEEIIDPVTKARARPVTIRSTAHFRPELGESITTALQRNIDRMAVQIVSAMECGW